MTDKEFEKIKKHFKRELEQAIEDQIKDKQLKGIYYAQGKEYAFRLSLSYLRDLKKALVK